MRRLFVGCLSILGIFFLLIVGGLGYGAWHLSKTFDAAPELPNVTLVSLSLKGAPAAEEKGGIDALFNEDQTSLRRLVDGIDRAAEDGRVQGLFVDLSQASLSMSDAEELAGAVRRLRQAGKPAYVFADTFGEVGDGTATFALASAFDQVWMQPSGEVRLMGAAIERPYIAETLRMLGVSVRLGQRHEFKGFADIFTDEAMNPAFRAQMQRLVDDMTAQAVAAVAEGRKLDPDAVKALMAVAPLPAQDAINEKLVDRLGYRAEALLALQTATKTGALTGFSDYASGAGLPRSVAATSGAAIAVIEATGEVTRGDGEAGPFGEQAGFASERLAKAFGAAARNPDVRAILFRIDSPGGSYVASDTVWASVKAAQAAGKPVVVSMGRLAASGGYFAAAPADRIIANAGTLTGSIGVAGGKFVLSDLWAKLGVSWDRVEGAPHAASESPNRDFTAEELARQQQSLDRIYADFTRKVAEGRKIPIDGMDAVARGRVWTGLQAKDIGLVDMIGGWREAVWEAKKLAKLSPDLPVHLINYPERPSGFDRAKRLLSTVEKSGSAMSVMTWFADRMQPWMVKGELTGPVR
ncbi:S49 family peptidase [Lacibacterium aquatile]|uniref:S49 family peptidase n=1 Tax=Lacibacterium aquatile TaxID=1168082 RepID=A0ABW5DRR7_9PROT